jgi:hypothetical protein
MAKNLPERRDPMQELTDRIVEQFELGIKGFRQNSAFEARLGRHMPIE